MVRTVIGVVVGVVVLGIVVMLLQQVSSAMYPMPEGVTPSDREAFAAWVAGMPALGWLAAACSELIGAGLGALTAGSIARDAVRGASGFVVGLSTVGSVMNWTAFPHPTWFIVLQLVLYPAVLVAVWAFFGRRQQATAAV